MVGKKPGERRGGCQPGVKNKRTLARETAMGQETQRISIPTIKFDRKLVTKEVKSHVNMLVGEIDELGFFGRLKIKSIAIEAVSRGRDAALLYNALSNYVSKKQASLITIDIINSSTSIINTQRMISAGIIQAKWMFSGTNCGINFNLTPEEAEMNDAHMQANGMIYDIRKGAFLNGRWTHPGMERGCKCCARSIIQGLEHR